MSIAESIPYLRHLIIGKLTHEYALLPDGQAVEDASGGSALYASAGAAVWDRGIGMVARVEENYPAAWLKKLGRWSIDARGVRRVGGSLDTRRFTAYADMDTPSVDNPLAHYARVNLPFPKSLLGYTPAVSESDSRVRPTHMTIRGSDFPEDYLDAIAAHICPLDFLSHTLLPGTLRQGNVNTITLDPGPGYMNPTFWDDLPVLMNGLSAFLCSEEKLSSLFQGRTADPWEMAEELTQFGVEIVVVKRAARGQLVYEKPGRSRWIVPAYPARRRNPTGVGDAFCGGFLAGFVASYDPLQATLQGNISASLVIEGISAYYAFDAMPGLSQARLDSLRDLVRKA